MANFNGGTFAAVNAIASEVANIQLRLYKVTGDDHQEQDDYPLMTLLDGVNERMTGIELKYVTMAHLKFTGNLFVCEMDQPRALYSLDPGGVCVKLDKSALRSSQQVC
jgi:phage portal protein BeeE